MLKLYNNATNIQRFLAFLIDGIIILTLTIGISSLIFLAIDFNYSAYNACRNEFVYDYLLSVLYGGNYSESFSKAFSEYVKFSVVFNLVISSIGFVTFGLYFVLLPSYWEKQTLGRALLKIKVIGYKGDIKPGLKRLILREILGTWFLYLVLYSILGGIVIIVSAFVALISSRSLVDRISNTVLVIDFPIEVKKEAFENNKFDKEEASNFKPNPSEFRKDDAIDAEIKDIGSNDSKEKDDNSDDEYQIF